MPITYTLKLTRAQHAALTTILGDAMRQHYTFLDCTESPEGTTTSAAELFMLAMNVPAEVTGEAKPLDRDYMRTVAALIRGHLPDGFGFILLAFKFQCRPGEGRLIYTSNARRKDVLAVLKEFLLQAGATEDWMQHIG